MSRHPMTPQEGLAWGTGITLVSLLYLILILFRYQWLLQFALMRALLRWGRGSRSYPASKWGAFIGGLLMLGMGCNLLDRYFTLLSDKTWAIIFVSMVPIVIGAAIYDYRQREETARLHEAAEPAQFDDDDD